MNRIFKQSEYIASLLVLNFKTFGWYVKSTNCLIDAKSDVDNWRLFLEKSSEIKEKTYICEFS